MADRKILNNKNIEIIMKKTVKIKFVDFFRSFDPYNNDFIRALEKRYKVEITDSPDYIIYSGFGFEHLKYDCVRIFFTGECITPDFNECDYAIGFDRLQFGDRYVRIPLYNLFQYKADYQYLKNKKQFTIDDIRKRGFCSFVVSNCFAKEERANFFELLSQYKVVASGGRYKNNIGGAVADKKQFLSQYKFNIAFENCSHVGYVTEKITEAFAAGVIPIYYGDPRIVEDFNPDAFLNVHSFKDYDALVKRIQEIDHDDVQYLKMLNAPAIAKDAVVADLDTFLYNIFDQSQYEAFRRPFSQPVKNQESFKKRHSFFEAHIYRKYKRIKNQILRCLKGFSIIDRRIK